MWHRWHRLLSALMLVFLGCALRTDTAHVAHTEEMPRYLAGIFCNTAESAEYVAWSLTRSPGERGIVRAHMAMHIQQGRAGIVYASHPARMLHERMRPLEHPLWCAWQIKLVQHPTLFRGNRQRGEVVAVALVNSLNFTSMVQDFAAHYVVGTEVPPEVQIVSTEMLMRELSSKKK